MKGLARAVLAKLNLQISRIDPSTAAGRLTPYEIALLTLLSGGRRLRIVQVGANDGAINDPIFRFVRLAADRTEVVLVEPQNYLIPYLAANYDFHPRKYIFNGAVGARGEMKLYAVNESHWDRLEVGYGKGWPRYRAPTGVTSTDRNHVQRWLNSHLKRGHRTGDAIVELQVPSRPLQDILQSFGLSGGIDALQIDAEGNDDQVIYECSISSLRPRLIFFESANLSLERLRALGNFLEKEGYMLAPQGSDTLAILTGDIADAERR